MEKSGGPLKPIHQSCLLGDEKLQSQGVSFTWSDFRAHSWERPYTQGIFQNTQQQLWKITAAWSDITRWSYQEAD